MTEYIIRVDGKVQCKTSWQPMASAAWSRAAADSSAARNNDGRVDLLVDGRIVSSTSARTGKILPWPVTEDAEVDLTDVAAAVLQLCRAAGVPASDLADEMTKQGLSTTRSRLKSISTIEQGRRSKPSAAEIVVMCYAAIGHLKK